MATRPSSQPLILHRIQYVTALFAEAKTPEGFFHAAEEWEKVRKDLMNGGSPFSCADFDHGGDFDLISNIAYDLSGANVGLILASFTMILHIAAQEGAELVEDVKKVNEEMLSLIKEEGVKKATEELKSRLGPIIRESIIQSLQKMSKRSRKHFTKIVDNLAAMLGTTIKGAAVTASYVFTSSKIAPDNCGAVMQLEEARKAASSRIFGSLPPSFHSAPVQLTPNKPTLRPL